MKSFSRLFLLGLLAFGTSLLVSSAQSIYLNAGTIDTGQPAKLASARATTAATGNQLRLVQFDGPIQPAWVEQLTQDGCRIVDYIPDNAYLVYGGPTAMKSLRARTAHLQWEGAYLASDKVNPRARRASAGSSGQFAVQMVLDESANAETVALLEDMQLAPMRSRSVNRRLGFLNIVATLPADRLGEIAARPDVVSINTYVAPHKCDERQDQIVAGNTDVSGSQPSGTGYLAWLSGKGFTQAQFDSSAFVVDIADDGWDLGVAASPADPVFRMNGSGAGASRVVYSQWGSTLAEAGSWAMDGHGNLNISIVGGYDNRSGSPHEDGAGYNYGLGVCPFAYMGNTKVFDDDGNWAPTDEEELAYIDANYAKGVRISSDSWGMPGDGVYDIYAQNYDTVTRDAQPGVAGNQECLFVFAAGNDGSGATTIGAPGTAKNIITVGASENYNAIGTDGCAVPDTGADNANDIIDFSSRGPCTDLRKKPDIVAPGTHIQGAASLLGGYTGLGVCDKYMPAGQTNYASSSGTSHSTPAVAGGCALVRQYFINQGWTVPSPAMVKAFLMNSARYLTGVDANDTLPSNNQGMGGLNLGTAFDGTSRFLRDQLAEDVFTASGQTRTFYGPVADPGKPLLVTLGWTDAPGSTAGNAYKNNLNLVVVVNGTSYKGNVFSGAYSAAGGTADARNNVESVFLPAGTTGTVQVTVTGANITSDGIPDFGGSLDQDFALVIYNITPPELDITPTATNLPAEAVAGNAIAVAANTSWTATPSVSWLSVTGGGAGSGNGTVIFDAQSNFWAAARTGTVVVAGSGLTRVCTVVQAGAPPALSIPASATLPAIPYSSRTIAVDANMPWTATASPAWLMITSGAGDGPGTAAFNGAINEWTAPRTGTVVVAGGGLAQTCTVVQAAAAAVVFLTPEFQQYSGAAASDQRVAVSANTEWTAVSSAGWLRLVAGAAGTGNGTLVYEFDINRSAPRTATLTVTGGGITRTFTVNQGQWIDPDAYEGDNTSAASKSITSGQTQNRSIHTAGDADWAKIAVGAPGAMNFRLETAGSAPYDTELWLYKSSGAVVAYDDESGTGHFSRILIDYLAAGTYYAKILEFGNNGTIPAYTLAASWVAAPPAADAYESDNSMAAARAIANGQTQNRTIHAVGNTDWVVFTVGGRGARNLKLETSGANGDTQLWLYRSNGTQLAYNNDSGTGRFSRITMGTLPAGTYYAKIQENGNNGTIAAYQLHATWTNR